jgi:hypothetical protein
MEPEVREFLKRVSLSIGATFGWLFINLTIGIFLGWLFFENTPTTGNIIFYTWLVGSAAGLVFLFIRIWRNRQVNS